MAGAPHPPDPRESIFGELSILRAALERVRSAMGSLRARIVLGVGLVALLALGSLGIVGGRAITRFLADQANVRLHDAARRSALLIESLLVEREREVAMLASSPMLVDAAREGAARATLLGLEGMSIAILEREFDADRSLQVDGRVRTFLRTLLPQLGIAEIMLTDASGLNAVTSSRTTDFVQRDEEWWQQAMREGEAPATVVFDESVRQVVMSMALAVREGVGDAPEGALKVSFSLARIDSVLRSVSAIGGIQVDLVDQRGRLIASSGTVSRLQLLPGVDRVLATPRDSIVAYDVPTSDGLPGRRLAAVDDLAGGRWRVIAHLDERVPAAQRRQALGALLVVAAALFTLSLATLVYLARALTNRVSRPAAELASVAERVAAGDLSVQLAPTGNEDEIGRLTRATRSMIADLRGLAGTIGDASSQTTAMAAEITVGAEHMAAAAQEMAAMSSDLSLQSNDMATTIRELAEHASSLVTVGAELDAGAREGIGRNERLRSLAGDNRHRLDASARALEALAGEATSNVQASEALSAASEEIRAFVALVQKIARQSKLLALNAAMEAARAGEHGEGFAVVAGEVRRLSSAAAEGAERTEIVVAKLLARVAESRAASVRAAETMQTVLEATQQGHESFVQVESAVGDMESWTTTIADSAHRANESVRAMTTRIDQLAKGTEAFAAAMEQVAASSEQQSASTQEISAAAERLTAAAEKLTQRVAAFRLERDEAAGDVPPAAAPEMGGDEAQHQVVSPQWSVVSAT